MGKSRETVHIRERVLDVCNVNHHARVEAIPLIHLEVIPVRPLARCSVSVVGVVLDRQIVSRSEVEIRQTDHRIQTGQLSWLQVRKSLFDASIRFVEEDSCCKSALGKARGKESGCAHRDGIEEGRAVV